MPILSWRCHQSTNTAGTGTLALNASAPGRRSFAQAFGAGARRVPYVIQGTSFYEMGYGDFDGGEPGTLARGAVIASSNSGALIALPVGTADVFSWIDPAQRGVLTFSGNLSLAIPELGNLLLWSGASPGMLSLPICAAVPEGIGVLIHNAGTAALTITPSGSEVIAGAAAPVLGPAQTVEVLRVGSSWIVTAGGGGGRYIGEIFFFGGSALPPLCVWAAGQALSRSTYAALFAVLGTTYGAGNGSTTFNVPDARGRTLFGLDTMGGAAANRLTAAISGVNGAALGATGGDERMHGHGHNVNDPGHDHGISDPGHAHSVHAVVRDYAGDGYGAGGWGQNQDLVTSTVGTGIGVQSAGTGIGIQAAGSGTSQNVPPALVCTTAIYAGV